MRFSKYWLLTLGALLIILAALSLTASAVPGDPPSQGDWIIAQNVEFTGKVGFAPADVSVSPLAKLTIKDAVLTVNGSIVVGKDANLEIINSTVQFNCSYSKLNRLDVSEDGRLTIRDKDDDPDTTGDASIITSVNSIPYNFTVFRNSTFEMRNSFVYKCGRPFNDPYDEEGLVIRADDVTISWSTISGGYFGLIVDEAERLSLENVTVSECFIGLYARGTRDMYIKSCTFSNNTAIGAQLRGFQGNLRMESNTFEYNGDTNLHLLFMSSSNINEVVYNTIGPVGHYGLLLEDVRDTLVKSNLVKGCDIGVEVSMGDLILEDLTVTNCTEGVIVADDADVSFVDLQLSDTTISVARGATCNITSRFTMEWEVVTGDLATSLVVPIGSTLTLDRCNLAFGDSTGGPTGIYALRSGTLNVWSSTVDSPVSMSLVIHLAAGSRVDMLDSTFHHLGHTSSNVQRLGLFAGGSGTMERVTLADSLVGLVVGKSQVNLVDLTITDCLTGILSDGDLGKGGVIVRGLAISDCDVSLRAVNDGAITIIGGVFHLAGEGFNLSASGMTIRDSWVSAPTTGRSTAFLRSTSTLDFINSSTSREFDLGPTENVVNIYWYLNLTLKYLSDGSPLSDAVVDAREVSGSLAKPGVDAGADGVIQEMELRELAYTPGLLVTTPHTITVTKDGLKDSFQVTMDASKDHTFYMDNYQPVLLVSSPEDGSVHNVSAVTFEGEAWDAVVTATEGLRNLRFKVDDGNWTPVTLPAFKTFTFEAQLEDGFHVVTVETVDLIGNRNWTTVSVEVDTTPPNLTIISPEDGLVTPEPEVTIVGRTDVGATVTIDGVTVVVAADGLFERTLTLADGTSTVVVRALDQLGNAVVRTRNITVDSQDPEVVLDQTLFRTNQLTFTLSGTKKANATIYVNGYLDGFFASTRFETQVSLDQEDLNTVNIWSEDLAGNNWSTSVVIERDTTPPTLTVANLPEYTNKLTITVQGTTDDPDATVRVNGEAVTLTGVAFSVDVQLSEGSNTITVEIEDDLGNAAEPDVQTLTADITPPSLTITSDQRIETLYAEAELEGETDPGLSVSVNVVFGPYSKTYRLTADGDGSFSVTVALPQVGNHTVTVTATDLAGNQASKVVYYVRNRQQVTPNGGPDGPSWISENWEYVILLAAIIASAAIWMFTLSAGKRRRETLARAQRDRAASVAEEEEWDEDEAAGEWEEGSDEVADEPEDEMEQEEEEEEEKGD